MAAIANACEEPAARDAALEGGAATLAVAAVANPELAAVAAVAETGAAVLAALTRGAPGPRLA